MLELNENYNLIENLSKRALKNPEGVGFDIRVKSVHKTSGNGYISAPRPEMVDIDEVEDEEGNIDPKSDVEEHQIVTKVKQEDCYLVETEPREQPTETAIADLENDELTRQTVALSPGERVLIKTIEKINIPPIDEDDVNVPPVDEDDDGKLQIEEGEEPRHIVPLVFPRSTLFRCGVTFEASKTDPGYSGRLTFAITNNGNESFVFELGARVANIVFATASGDLRRRYGGQQEGRTSAGGRERQN